MKKLFSAFLLLIFSVPASAQPYRTDYAARFVSDALHLIEPQIGVRYGGVKPAGAAYDTDAQAFFDAAGITDTTQKSAVNQLVLDLKSYSLWTKMNAIYPFVGGTATTHKYNLKDPRDADSAFRLGFNGSWTHNSNGVTGGGAAGDYADTFLVPSSSLSQDSKHISAWCKSTLAACPIGTIIVSPTITDAFLMSGSLLFVGLSGNTSNTSHTASTGLYCLSRTISTETVTYRNGSSILTGAQSSAGQPSASVYIGARHAPHVGGGNDFNSNSNLSFASIGGGLSSTEASNLYTAVNAFQTALGR